MLPSVLFQFYDNKAYRLGFAGLLIATKIVSSAFILTLYRMTVKEDKELQALEKKNGNASPELQKLAEKKYFDEIDGKETGI